MDESAQDAPRDGKNLGISRKWAQPTFFLTRPALEGRKPIIINCMHKPVEIIAQVEDLVAPLLQAQEVELVETEMVRAGKRWVLRLYVDKPGGISLDECARVSQVVGELLDVHDLIDQAYTLEISSPGLTRALKKPADYQRYVGRLARITTRAGAGERQIFRGELLGLEDDRVKLKEGDQIYQILLDDIARARLDVDF